MAKPKYLVYNTDKWWDGCSEEETLKWAETDFKHVCDDVDFSSEDHYIILAKITNCLSFKEIQTSKVKAKKRGS